MKRVDFKPNGILSAGVFWQRSVAVCRKAVPALMVAALLLASCGKDNGDDPGPGPNPPDPDPTPTPKTEYLTFATKTANQISVKEVSTGEYEMSMTGTDPYIFTNSLERTNPADSCILTFQYRCDKEISFLQLFFASTPSSGVSEDRSVKVDGIPASQTWKTWKANVSESLVKFAWGKAGNCLRVDFGDKSGIKLYIKGIHFRGMTEQEKQEAEEEEENSKSEAAFENNLKSYLSTLYPSSTSVTSVEAGLTKITVKGNCSASGSYSLCEIPPYVDLLKTTKFEFKTALTDGTFSKEMDRYVERDGFKYDRTLSKWAIVENGDTKDKLVSHARYATEIASTQQLPAAKPASKKGLGGYHLGGPESDLDDLGITSITMNVSFVGMMSLSPSGNSIAHEYGGKTYYFDKGSVENYDKTLQAAQKRNIVVAAILLVAPSSSEVGKLLLHPDYTSRGIYTMPNMTNPESVNCYAAALDFLASRYCQTGSPYGRIHHWIMHNEVDAGLDWTNMGVKPITIYTDTYLKSMRMCYNIARQYDPNTEVFASFTHSWTEAASDSYASRDMLDLLRKFGTAEGDFQWAVAYHPYPQDLNDAKTWNDNKASFNMNTKLVTFKNLEVLSAWAQKSENKYKKTIKRSVWLSENGTNSRTYADMYLKEQAAGFAYAWKKLKKLDGIDAMQWHNWIDHPEEYGLRIGLRKFPNDPDDPMGRKLVWYAYQAAGTSTEDAVFEPYKAVIGIDNWNIIQEVQ